MSKYKDEDQSKRETRSLRPTVMWRRARADSGLGCETKSASLIAASGEDSSRRQTVNPRRKPVYQETILLVWGHTPFRPTLNIAGVTTDSKGLKWIGIISG